MTMTREASAERSFVPALLPWIVSAAALGLYLFTLNPWLGLSSFQQPPVVVNSLTQAAKVAGWTWQPELFNPLFWLATYPFRWLPTSTIPVALNLFAAVCAALVLALLARSVALLPHDRTEEQRIRERSPNAILTTPLAWIPPVLAAAVCGLQLTFWENATVVSGEIFDLLLFAYLVRCLLEYRTEKQDSWLFKAAFVYGAAMTNNWAMIGFLPIFVAAVGWTKGLSFFNARFLLRSCLLGLAGLSFYLLLPLVNALSTDLQFTFWQALKHNLATQKAILFYLPFSKAALFNPDRPLWILALPSLLPILVMAPRWPSYFGDPSKLGVTLATVIFHFFHAVLLGLCLWVALDPQFSPRHVLPGVPMLTFYYLGAISAGYFTGYFLLVFGAQPTGRPRMTAPWITMLNRSVAFAICLLALLAPAALVYLNWNNIRVSNGPMLKEFASLLAQDLPRKAVILSDDPRRLILFQATLSQAGKTSDRLLVDTGSLPLPQYHRYLSRRAPGLWPTNPPPDLKDTFDAPQLIQIMAPVARSNAIFYLHPSFGYYFEIFYPEPHGLDCNLLLYGTNLLLSAPPSPAVVARNVKFWDTEAAGALERIIAASAPPAKDAPAPLQRLRRALKLPAAPNRDATTLAAFYSRSLNYWGVELQRSGRLKEAGPQFERALKVNPENLVAEVNLECNRNLRAEKRTAVQMSQSIEDRFGRYRNWDQVMNDNGPFDEPNFCSEQGRIFVRNGNLRQAATQFARVVALAPDNLTARILLAQIAVVGQFPKEALKVVAGIHSDARLLGLSRTNFADVLAVETTARLALGDVAGAETVVRNALARYPGDENLLATAATAYMNFGCYSNAVGVLDEHLKVSPDNVFLLAHKGFACLQLNAFLQAIPPLTRVLTLETNATSDLYYSALLNRAIAYLKTDQYDDARRDYEVLLKAFPNAHKIYFGLGEIAYLRHDTNEAIRNYQLYLANTRTNTIEASNVVARLTELKRGT